MASLFVVHRKEVNMAVKQDTKLCRGNGSDFFNCSGLKFIPKDFFVSWSRFSDGYVPLCKTCLNKLWKYWLEETKEEKTALYYCLSQIDIPFIKEVYEEVIKSKGKITLNAYITELHKRPSNKEIYENFACTDVTDISKLGTKIATLEEQKQENDRLRKIWGIQETNEDYEFLEETYERYTKDIEEIEVSQETLYKKLCLAELSSRKKESRGDSTKEELDQILKIMGKLKIDNFVEKKKKTDIEKILERQIWEIENTEPAEIVDKNVYKDYLNIHSDWGEGILRCVKNLLVGSKEYPNITRDSNKY